MLYILPTVEADRIIRNANMILYKIYNKRRKHISKIAGKIIQYYYPLKYKLLRPSTLSRANSSTHITASLTTFPARIETVHLTIESIIRQSVRPDRIVLWLAKDEFERGQLPAKLRKLKGRGVEIRYCENLRSHKKYYYAFIKFPEDIIITFDDDVFYPEDTIERLLNLHHEYNDCVCCNAAQYMRELIPDTVLGDIDFDNRGFIKPSPYLMAVGIGAVLYPPGCMHNDVFDKSKIRNLAWTTDDIYLKFMSYLNGTKVCRAEYRPNPIGIKIKKNRSLMEVNHGFGMGNESNTKRLIQEYKLNEHRG